MSEIPHVFIRLGSVPEELHLYWWTIFVLENVTITTAIIRHRRGMKGPEMPELLAPHHECKTLAEVTLSMQEHVFGNRTMVTSPDIQLLYEHCIGYCHRLLKYHEELVAG